MVKDVQCSHYKGDGYYYKIKDNEVCLCDKCNRALLIQMKKQEELEKEMKPLADKFNKIAKQKRRRRKSIKW